MTLLEVQNLNVSYGDLQVLWDISLQIEQDESVVALIGPNGAGKTTLLKTLSGILELTSGKITIFGEDMTNASPKKIVNSGFVHVSEERNLFGEMSVQENLKMGAYTEREKVEERMREVYDMFPVLEERKSQRAGTMSGGEQQMLAIGRGLMSGPKLLAFDEPSGALAPQLVNQVFEKIDKISDDIPVLIVEQHVDKALELADRAYIIENGRISAKGQSNTLIEDDQIVDAYL